jgi:hypothetical protein
MNPILRTFIRLTLLIAVVILGLFLVALVFKVLLVAALVAGVVLGGLFLYNMIRGRIRMPAIRR